MSQSTLDDFYRGMRVPKYDGQNVLSQIKQMTQMTTTQKMTMTQTTATNVQGVPPINNIDQVHNKTSSFKVREG